MRVDAFLYEQGKFSSRTKAAEAIAKGLVTVNGVRAKASCEVGEGDDIVVEEQETFVSAGGYKLEKARREFGLDFSHKIYADIGASTGGYTDCLLKNGAAKVYAVDVGRGQLAAVLSSDQRVVVMDGVNARELESKDFAEPLDGLTVDCSFISLKLLLKPLADLLGDGKVAVILIKPQFELETRVNYKNGIVRDRAVWRKVAENIYDFAIGVGLIPVNFTNAPIVKDKNVEFLMLLKKNYGEAFDRRQIAILVNSLMT